MFFNCLFYNKFHGLSVNADEIHPDGQIGNVNLLGFSRNVALQQGLSHQVGDAVGGLVW